MATPAQINATLALAESLGFSVQQWDSGVWVLTSGPRDQRLCTDCGRWRKVTAFRQLSKVCINCVRVRGRLAYARKKIKERREE